MAAAPHILVFPHPALSHVTSLLELSYRLLDRGFKITFLNTEFNHRRLLVALPNEQAAAASALKTADGLRLATIPDGLGPDEDRNDLRRLMEGIMAAMPEYLEKLMLQNAEAESEEDKFSCFITDLSMGWSVDTARKVGLRPFAYFPMAAALLAASLSIPKLIQGGVIDKDGAPIKGKMFQLSPKMPPIDPAEFTWNCLKDSRTKKHYFKYTSNNFRAVADADLILCNTFHELEKPVFACAHGIVPIGPLLGGSRADKIFGKFGVEDTKCIDWLDRQEKNSVIYVAFGSFTVLNQNQFQELAHGLELVRKPFLWVVRAGLAATDDDGSINLADFIERVGDRGRIVSWCPQQKVLAHPAVACFITHCGWNSTLEGLRNGVPFLCWPYFADQFFNQTYICDIWRVGLRIVADESGIYSKERITSKLEALTDDKEIKERSLALKEMACKSMENGGSSFNNFNKLIDFMKGV